jgi:hypothetical protein
VGQFKDDKMHDYGEFFWPSGENYKGMHANDQSEGHGTYCFANGDKYEGSWKNDLKQGEGTFYTKANGTTRKVVYTGDKFVRWLD